MFKYFSSTFPTLSSKSEAWRKAMGAILNQPRDYARTRILEYDGLYYVDVCPPGSNSYCIEDYDIPTFEEAKALAEEYR